MTFHGWWSFLTFPHEISISYHETDRGEIGFHLLSCYSRRPNVTFEKRLVDLVLNPIFWSLSFHSVNLLFDPTI